MTRGVSMLSRPPTGSELWLRRPPPTPVVVGDPAGEFDGSADWPRGGVVGRLALGTPAGAPVFGAPIDGVVKDWPGVGSGVGPVPLGMELVGAVALGAAPVVPLVEGEAAPVVLLPPVPAAPPPAPPAPAPPAPPPAPPPPCPTPRRPPTAITLTPP